MSVLAQIGIVTFLFTIFFFNFLNAISRNERGRCENYLNKKREFLSSIIISIIVTAFWVIVLYIFGVR